MAKILLSDDGIAFDGTTPDRGPLGGAESAVVALLEALAARGHEVSARNHCNAPVTHKGVGWAPLDSFPEHEIDLYIANRNAALLRAPLRARRSVFWIHNPAHYLTKLRHLVPLCTARPAIVFSGAYHASTLPRWVPIPAAGRVIIPYGIDARFLDAEPLETAPPARAIFTSNPLRGLSWLLDLWEREIAPQAPAAELHVFSGAATYGSAAVRKSDAMGAVLAKAQALAGCGVRLRDPVPKSALIGELRQARVMPYGGDPGETFCLALGEAQAMGVPCVVKPVGSVGERVRDGQTGTITTDDHVFASNVVRLLTDDSHWRAQHLAALALQRSWTWDDAAKAFERFLVPSHSRA